MGTEEGILGEVGMEMSKLSEEAWLEGKDPEKLLLLLKENVLPELVILSVPCGCRDDLRLI